MSPQPTVVLLHGAASNHLAFEPLAAQLDGALAVSLPGRLDSPGPPLSTVAEMAEWLETTLSARGIDNPVLVGHSMGGALAMEYAARHGASGLVLMMTGARLRVRPELLALFEQAALSGSAVPIPAAAWHPRTPEAIRRRYQQVTCRTPSATALADWRASDAFDRLGQLDDVRAPALVIAGERDPLTPPRYTDYLARALGAGPVHTIADTGHLAPFERPGPIAQLIARFVGR